MTGANGGFAAQQKAKISVLFLMPMLPCSDLARTWGYPCSSPSICSIMWLTVSV